MEKIVPLESKGVRVLTKCNRRQIEIVATQTILKVDKRPGKHISLQQRIDEEHEMIPASTIQTGLKIKLSAPRETNKQWQQRGPWA